MSLNIYVPRDERFGHLKMADFLAYALKSVAQFIKPELQALADSTPNEFDSFDDVLKLYEGGFKLPDGPLLENLKKNIPLEMLKEIIRTDGEGLFRFPKPQVIQANNSAWRTDEEFGREMLSGVNPVIISLIAGNSLPKSKLDRKLYGDQNSTITEEHIKDRLDGLAIDEAIEKNRMFILDHHDALMPYLRRINTTTTKTYATRTLLFLKDDGTLKPIAIELSLPHEEGDEFGAISKVYSPAEHGVEGTIWELAKAYVAVKRLRLPSAY
ncbi:LIPOXYGENASE [Salix purpurea]|uniref:LIPOXYGENASE n=1 Tax=Salix purpurea TaxID=77065 RepID=A0A9Q0WXY7_SALPP|nr:LIPOXYGENASE [Salix purpurea]